jgi:hypothetical protein
MRENENPVVHTDVSLREYVDTTLDAIRETARVAHGLEAQRREDALALVMRLLDERDRRYEERFVAANVAVSAALVAQEKQTAAAFLASEKAIVKAEDAQREYNIRSNEFRGQLDDQAKTLMPRTENAAELKGIEGRIEAGNKDREKKYDDLVSALALIRESKATKEHVDTLGRDVALLRDAQHAAEGRQTVADPMMETLVSEMRGLTARSAADAGKAQVTDPLLVELAREVRALVTAQAAHEGKSTVADPALLELLAEVHRNSATLAAGAGRSAGLTDGGKLLIGAVGLLLTVLSIGGMIFGATRSLATAPSSPQIIYVPSPPGTMLPTTPPAAPPR